MFRNYFAAALRNLARNRLYSGIGIFALSIGLCAALLMGLMAYSELSYDHFIAGFQHTYLAGAVLMPPGRAPMYNAESPSAAAALLKNIPNPTDADIDAYVDNICRCGTYPRVRAAIHKAAAGSRV